MSFGRRSIVGFESKKAALQQQLKKNPQSDSSKGMKLKRTITGQFLLEDGALRPTFPRRRLEGALPMNCTMKRCFSEEDRRLPGE